MSDIAVQENISATQAAFSTRGAEIRGTVKAYTAVAMAVLDEAYQNQTEPKNSALSRREWLQLHIALDQDGGWLPPMGPERQAFEKVTTQLMAEYDRICTYGVEKPKSSKRKPKRRKRIATKKRP